MSQDWLTIHWPHPLERNHPWNVYLRNRHDAAQLGRRLAVGDRVFFYETTKGQDEIGRPPLPHGRGGIVAAAKVSEPLRRRPQSIHHTDGTISYWEWEIPCDGHDFNGYCACRQAAVTLGYSERYNFRGYANGLGLDLLDTAAAIHLMAIFKTNAPRPIKPRKVKAR